MSCCEPHTHTNAHNCGKTLKGDISCVGITAGWTGTAKDSLKCCELLKCKSAQLYGHNLFTNKNTEKPELKAYLEDKGITLVVHAPLCINLADEENEKKYKGMLQSELYNIQDLPAILNFHIGSGGSIERVAQNINSMNIRTGTHEKYPIQLCAEVSAGTGSQLGKNFEELRKLYEGLDKKVLRFCIDSQHIFGSGMCDFNGHESIVKLFDSFDEFEGKVSLIHLNDSKVDFNSKIDRHAGIEKGKIWCSNNESLKSLLQRIAEHQIDTVLETGSNQIQDLRKIQSYFTAEI
jgi:deoxyribonuclease-4